MGPKVFETVTNVSSSTAYSSQKKTHTRPSHGYREYFRLSSLKLVLH